VSLSSRVKSYRLRQFPSFDSCYDNSWADAYGGGGGGFGPESGVQYGGTNWGNVISNVISGVVSGVSNNAGGGGSAGVSCAQDPKFQAQHGQEFWQRARQYGVPAIALWYGNMMQVDPSGRCSRIGYIGGPGGQATYDLAKQFLANLGTKMVFWGARQPEGGWQFYAPPNYIGDAPPAGFQPPQPQGPSTTSTPQLPGIPQTGGPGPVYPGQQYPYGGTPVQTSMLGRLDMSSILTVGGIVLLLFKRKKK
jgi:hypothetical protein